MRKLASIQRIKNIEPIENADRVELITIQGWKVVCKKDEFKIDELVVYIEIDSILPEKLEFEFLRPRNFKIKTAKLAGVYSQGIVFPLNIIPVGEADLREGEDLTSILGVTKVEENEPIQYKKEKRGNFENFLYRFKWIRNLVFQKKQKETFVNYISKTDESRIQNLSKEFENEWKGTSGWSVSEKCEGQSGTFGYTTQKKKFLKFFTKTEKRFDVCSRSLWLKTPHKCSWWDVAVKYNIQEKLAKVPYDVVIQGEIIGPSIQGNIYKLKEYELKVFNVKNVEKNVSLTNEEIQNFCYEFGFSSVPMISNNFTLPETIDQLVEYSHGNSVIKTNILREGVVIRKGNISFKVINPKYLLKNNK